MKKRSDKFTRQCSLALVCCVVLLACSRHAPYVVPTNQVGVVAVSTGYPSVLRNARPYILAEQSAIYPGDVITTDEQSLVRINLDDRIQLQLGTHSRLLVSEYVPSGNSARVMLSLSSGSLEVTANRPGDRYEITTTMALVRTRSQAFWIGYDRTSSEMDVVLLGQGALKVSNRDGSIELTRRLESSRVTAGAAPLESLEWSEARFNEVREQHNRIKRL